MSEPIEPWEPPPDPTPGEHVHDEDWYRMPAELPAEPEPLAGQTPRGLPYPTPSEPVAQGAAAIQSLAEAVDPVLGAEYYYAEHAGDIVAAPSYNGLFDSYIDLPGGVNYRVEYWFAGYVTDHTASWARLYCHAVAPDSSDRVGCVDLPLTNMTIQFGPVYIARRIGGMAGRWRFSLDIGLGASSGQIILKGNTGTDSGYFPLWFRVSKW
jgi:hypothetical protein